MNFSYLDKVEQREDKQSKSALSKRFTGVGSDIPLQIAALSVAGGATGTY